MRMRMQEAVHLRFGQGIGAVVLDGILRGQHHEGLRQRVGVGVHGDLGLVHGLQQRRLRFRRGAVDLVGQDDVGEDRAGLELELLLDLVEDADAHHVAGQHVRSELDALEGAVERMRQGLRQRGLAHAGHVFDQQMAARQQGDQRQLDGFVLAANHAREWRLAIGRSGKRWLWSW